MIQTRNFITGKLYTENHLENRHREIESLSLSLFGNRIPRLHNEVSQCGRSFSVNQSSQPSKNEITLG